MEMEAAIVVTKAELKNYFAAWEQDKRAGKTATVKETNARSVDEVAEANATNMFDHFKAK